jgi:hypothetical protein
MALDLTPLDRAVSQLQTFYTLSMQPQEQAVMAEALRHGRDPGVRVFV